MSFPHFVVSGGLQREHNGENFGAGFVALGLHDLRHFGARVP